MEELTSALGQAFLILGIALAFVGAFCDLVGSIGLLRFPSFFVRLHAATVGIIGGAAYPLVGVALVAAACDFLGPARWFVVTGSVLTSIIIVLTAPAGSHALARAAHRAGVPVEPKVCDLLEEDRGRRG
ncbi:MAG: monovalent cation/H(+) antiporter subunit G [Candidatus Nezhaarchaeota archaeon]|nr:monovalent cation/H(+) antiporter subunit G [Candidatus Nezhaarchaeota archaeon]